MHKSIIHHAFEEEARLMRIIMRIAKDESPESIRIMQEHNCVLDFFKNKLTSIEQYTKSPSSEPKEGEEFEQAKNDLSK